MNVLQLGKFFPFSGGVERVMYDLASGLSLSGCNCDILCASISGKKDLEIEINDKFQIYATKSCIKVMRTVISPAMITKLKRVMDYYDIIHIHHPDPMAALALHLSGFNGKVILHWHSDIVKQKKALLFYSILQTWLLKRSNVIVTTSPLYMDSSPFLFAYKNKCVSIPIGVEKICLENEVSKIRQQYAGKKIVYSLGRLIYYKGYEYLIDSAEYLDDTYIILIGGGGPLYENLQQQIREKKLEGRVKLLGRVPDEMMAKYYQMCDIFCLSSVERTEAFGIAQIEAMSFGKPIVATRIPGSGVSWVNEDGVSGLNVECRDSKGLAKAFQQIMSDASLYHTYSAGAMMRYETLFTKGKMIENILSLYRQVLQ